MRVFLRYLSLQLVRCVLASFCDQFNLASLHTLLDRNLQLARLFIEFSLFTQRLRLSLLRLGELDVASCQELLALRKSVLHGVKVVCDQFACLFGLGSSDLFTLVLKTLTDLLFDVFSRLGKLIMLQAQRISLTRELNFARGEFFSKLSSFGFQ